MKILNFIILITLFCNSSLYAQENNIYYTITPIPLEDRTDLLVTISIKSEVPLKINPLKDKFGTPDIHKYVTKIVALEGLLSKANDTISPNKKNEIVLEYRLSYNPSDLINNTYSPNISENNFHVFNCQWMIGLGDNTVEYLYNLKIIDLPDEWDGYNSFNKDKVNMSIKTNYDGIFSRVIGAAKNSKSTYLIDSKPLDIFTYGSYDLTRKEIHETTRKIIEKQREFFNDYNFPFFNVIILPKEDNVAGINVTKNTFVCLVKKDVSMEQLTWIIAHEVFHTWLGKKIDIELDEDARIYRDHWFTEGFTDYFANKIRLESGVISSTQFANNMNQYLINIADNPYSNYTLSELEMMAKNGNYGIEAIKLQYYRGALIALNIESSLKESNSEYTLQSILNDLLQEAKEKEDGFTRKQLFDFFNRYGLDLKTPFDDHIINGKTIIPKSNALGIDYQLESTTHAIFDLGFDYSSTRKSKVIIGVEKDGAAYKAGLRDGMNYINISNHNRFGAAWVKNTPITVQVSINNKTEEISYYPKGKIVQIPQFVKY
jgi:predicted metalloprotease with PDZ domain